MRSFSSAAITCSTRRTFSTDDSLRTSASAVSYTHLDVYKRQNLERVAIQKALEDNRWNKTKAAAQLGITFRALRYKLKKLGME